ncbi:MAG: hypothetical protein KJ674_03890 [Nanoarchaeota archaeon]|nr:hypothetical protein [Nanoarchaeota archaeon]
MKLKKLAVTLFSLFAINAYSQDFDYKYSLSAQPIFFLKPTNIGEASINYEKNEISARVFVPKEDLDLKLIYNFETKQYHENEEPINLLPETQNILTLYLECLKHLRDKSLESRIFHLTTSYNQNDEKILILTYKDIQDGLLEFKIEDSKGYIDIEKIKYIKLYYSLKNKNIEKVEAIRCGLNITGELQNK